MRKSYQKVFTIFVLGLLFLPLGYMFGGKEKTRLAGVDPQTDLPSLQTTKFKTKQFQQQFEKWWQSHFLYRKIALKLKNQLYDWANFGQFHANRELIEGKKLSFSKRRNKCSLHKKLLSRLEPYFKRFIKN